MTAPTANAAETERIGGSDRVDTAVKVFEKNRSAFTSDTAVLTRADGFADALTATPLAAAHKAPVLNTSSGDLDARVLAALKAQGIKKVFAIGGEGALKPAVLAKLTSAGIVAERVGGTDRFDTAHRIADLVMKARGTQKAPVYLATGSNFPDALAAGTAASASEGVVMLSQGTGLDPQTRAFLRSAKASSITAVGGPAAAAARTASSSVTEVIGKDRYDTAAKLAKLTFTKPSAAVMASGETFADSLAGGVLAALRGGPLLLTPAKSMAPQTKAYLQEFKVDTTVLGGPAAVSNNVVTDVTEVVTPGPAPTPSPTPTPPSGGGGGGGGGPQVTSVEPAWPWFTDNDGTAEDTYTIPEETGVDYYVGDAKAEAGFHAGTGTVTVTARPSSSNYALRGTTTWTHTFATTTDIDLVRPAYTDGRMGDDNTIHIPTVEHVTWSINNSPVTGDHTISGDAEEQVAVTLVATAADGYTVNGQPSTPFEYYFRNENTKAIKYAEAQWPTSTEAAGKSNDRLIIPSTTGVVYKVGNTEVSGSINPWQPDVVNALGYVSVTATAADGWILQGSGGPFSIPFTAEVAAAAPTVKADADGTDDDKYTIPVSEGIIYKVDGQTKAAGDHSTDGASAVIVTAEADTANDYTLVDGATTTWTLDFATTTTATPGDPTTTDGDGKDDDKLHIPTVTGVVYKIGDEVVSGDVDPWEDGKDYLDQGGKVTVTAVAANGYVLPPKDGGWTWELTFTNETDPTP